jgi:uncharacterized protein YndB with AHSA1/START domain
VTVAPGDQAVVSVFVRVSPTDAFEVFTNEIELWWRTGPAYRIAGKRRGRLALEAGVGGRLFETFEGAHGERTFVFGTITVWEPGARLSFVWRGVNFAEGESTTVDVTFTAQNDGTLVRVRHFGWSSLPEDHPARHGLVAAPFARMIGLFWGSLMTGLREYVEARVVR